MSSHVDSLLPVLWMVVQDALDRNNEIQAKKRRDFDERIAAASIRAQEKSVEMLEVVKKQAEDRKKKEDGRVKVWELQEIDAVTKTSHEADRGNEPFLYLPYSAFMMPPAISRIISKMWSRGLRTEATSTLW